MPLTNSIDRLYPGEAVAMVGGQRSKAMADEIMAVAKVRLVGQLGVHSKGDLLLVEDALGIDHGFRQHQPVS